MQPATRNPQPATRNSQHATRLYLILFLAIAMISFASRGQTLGKSFFLLPYQKSDLQPISQTSNGKYLELQFSNSDGNLIYEGADFTTSVEIGKKYKLEVVALSDGFKDYAEVEANYKPNRITGRYPNPASNTLEITYKVNSGATAYLSITGIAHSNISNNYVLDLEQNSISLNIDALPVGNYVVALMVNGEMADSKNIIKN